MSNYRRIVKTMLLLWILSCVSLLFLISNPALAKENPIVLRAELFWGPESPFTKNATNPYCKEIEDKSNGRIKIEKYYAGSLLKPGELYEGLVSGLADISAMFPVYERGKFYIESLLELPFALPENPETAHKIAKAVFEKWVNPTEIHPNIKMLIYDPSSLYRFISTKKITTLEDLQGLKFRTPGGIMTDVVKSLGGTPVKISSGEIYEAVQRGIADGTFHTIAACWSWKYYELVKYAQTPGLQATMLCMAMNKKKFNSLPKDLQEVILSASDKYQGSITHAYYNAEEDYLPKMGLEKVYLSQNEIDRWLVKLSPVWQAWLRDVKAKRDVDGKLVIKDLIAAWEEFGATAPSWMIELSK